MQAMNSATRGPQQHGVAARSRRGAISLICPLMRDVPSSAEQDGRADEQADVADAHGEERLQRGLGCWPPPPTSGRSA